MKNYLKIIFFNIVFVFVLILIAEFVCIYYSYREQNWPDFSFKNHLKNVWQSYFVEPYFTEKDFRLVSYRKGDKHPIAVIGCSYAYGLWLDENETISALLSKQTGRTVYNAGVSATSPREMLYILRNDELRKKLFYDDKNIEFVIYPYIHNHKLRLYTDIKPYTFSPYFKKVGDRLEYYKKNKLVGNSYIYKKLLELFCPDIEDTKTFELQKLYMKEVNEEIKRFFPHAKFVILVYEDYLKEDWESLKSDDIIIVKVSEISTIDVRDERYTKSKTDVHPNAKAWQIIVPALVKELDL